MSRRRSHIGRGPDVAVEFETMFVHRARSDGHSGFCSATEMIQSPTMSESSPANSSPTSFNTTRGGIVRAWGPKPDVPFRLEVADSDPSPPTPSIPRPVGGGGLILVGQLADDWASPQSTAARSSGQNSTEQRHDPSRPDRRWNLEIAGRRKYSVGRSGPRPGICPQEQTGGRPSSPAPPLIRRCDITATVPARFISTVRSTWQPSSILNLP